jgi:hypothetical protein
MSKISKEAKKEEAVKRLEELTKTFNLRPNILKYFKEDKLYYSYITCKGLLGTIDTINYDKRYAEVVDRFEEEYDCLVYHVILALAFEILISSSSTKSVYIPCEIRLFLKSIRLLITTLRSSAVR